MFHVFGVVRDSNHLHPANRLPYNTGAAYTCSGVSAEMIVIGIDPGLARLGYGVIEVTKGDIRMVTLWMYRNIGQGSPRFREITENIYCSRSTF